jgi:hypothetical protein
MKKKELRPRWIELFIYADSTGRLTFVFVDGAGAGAAPDTVAVSVKDSAGVEQKTLGLADLSQDAPPVTGHYYYFLALASDALAGVWRVECKVSIGDFDDFSKATFNVMLPRTQWISADEVKQYALVKYDSLNYATSVPFGSEYEFNVFIDELLIPRAQGHINTYCRRNLDTEYGPTGMPEPLRDIAARATANMIQYLVMNKMGPLIKVSDYRISIPVQEVLTKELLALLQPWTLDQIKKGRMKTTQYQTTKVAQQWGQ